MSKRQGTLPEGMVFEDPPRVSRRKTSRWAMRLAPLKDHPGLWVRVADDYKDSQSASTVASYLRKSKSFKSNGGEWEFAVRKNDDGKGVIYARYQDDTVEA